jgi:hypothetical protein
MIRLNSRHDAALQNMLLSLKGLENCKHLLELDASHNQLLNLKVSPYLSSLALQSSRASTAGSAAEFSPAIDEPQSQLN